MVNLPLVSIIIPTYKSNSSLKIAIDSVLNQSYKNIEVIVVDDNDPSTEYRKSTESIMNTYSENVNVIYIRHDKNKNGAAARNTGFIHSTGEYIGFLDDDDIFLESKIEKQVAFMEKNKQFQAVYCWRYQNGKLVFSEKYGDLSEELLSLSFTPYTSSILLTRESYQKINGFDESYQRHQDFEFLLKFFKSYQIGVVKEPLIEIKGNQVDNTLRGKDLEKLKIKFLDDFSCDVERIESFRKGFKKLVYAKHYSPVFWSYVKKREINSAFKIFIKYSSRCGFVFWKSIISHLVTYVNVVRTR